MSERIERSCETPSRRRYMQGCRCPGCMAANSAYQRRFEARKKRRGKVATPYVGATETREARERLQALVDRGVPLKAVARETSISRNTLRTLLGLQPSTHPKKDGGMTSRMSRKNYHKIMEIEGVSVAGGDLVPARATAAILGKLASMGMSVARISRLCEMSYSSAYRLVNMDGCSDSRIRASTARKVRERVLRFLIECGVEVDEHVKAA